MGRRETETNACEHGHCAEDAVVASFGIIVKGREGGLSESGEIIGELFEEQDVVAALVGYRAPLIRIKEMV